MTKAQDVYSYLMSNKKFKLHDTKKDWLDARRINSHEFMLGETAAQVNDALMKFFLEETGRRLLSAPKSIPEMLNTVIAICITDEKEAPFLAIHKDHLHRLDVSKQESPRNCRPKAIGPKDLTLQVAFTNSGYNSQHAFGKNRDMVLELLTPDVDYIVLGDMKKIVYITEKGMEKIPAILKEIGIPRSPHRGIPSHAGMPLR